MGYLSLRFQSYFTRLCFACSEVCLQFPTPVLQDASSLLYVMVCVGRAKRFSNNSIKLLLLKCSLSAFKMLYDSHNDLVKASFITLLENGFIFVDKRSN